MTKLIRIAQNYLLFSSPFVVACMVWSSLRSPTQSLSMVASVLWEVLSWNLMLWFTVLLLSLLALVFSVQARERTIKRLANIHERDEREQWITGQAARAAFLSSIAVVGLFLFLSVFHVEVVKTPPLVEGTKASRSLNISLSFDLFEKPSVARADGGQVLFESQTVSLSKSAVLLLALVWQLATFHWVARREA